MARPIKKGLDYFSHDTDASTSREIEYLEATHGLVGYAIYMKILERIYGHEGYYIPWTEIDAAIFAKRFGVDLSSLNEIIATCFQIGLFSEWVYEANKVLTSSGIQKRFLQATEKRTKTEIEQKYIVSAEKTTTEPETGGVSDTETQVNSAESTQRKVKESKEEERKEEENPAAEKLRKVCNQKKPDILKMRPQVAGIYDIEAEKFIQMKAGKTTVDPYVDLLRWMQRARADTPDTGKAADGTYTTPKSVMDDWEPPHLAELRELHRQRIANGQ